MTEIQKAIRLKRLQLGYSQEYMGFKLGITQKSYCKIEKGETRLTVEMLLNICDVLELNPKELV